jgi:hypothetical protein
MNEPDADMQMSEPLTDQDEVLFRQIHPIFLKGGLGSSPFMPNSSDKNLLSVDRGTLTDAAASYALYTSTGRQSEAVYGISVGEFGYEKLPCKSDPLEAAEGQPANPAHALADYSAHSSGQQKNVAKRLKQKALARGRLYPAP